MTRWRDDVDALASAQQVREASGLERDREALEQLRSGNLPAFIRRAVPVEFDAGAAGEPFAHITVCVLPDYLAIGSDSDYLLMPLGQHALLLLERREQWPQFVGCLELTQVPGVG